MVIILFILLLSPQKCIDLILENKISEAKKIYVTLDKSRTNDNVKFLNAYFNRDVNSSIKTYESLYLTTKNQKIKYLTSKKLYEYNYAKGLYIKAQNLLNSMSQYSFETNNFAENITASKYTIQCGVFGMESNALNLKEKIATIVKNEVYLNKDVVNGQEVIRVYIGGFESYQQAETIKKRVDSEFGLKSMIKELEE